MWGFEFVKWVTDYHLISSKVTNQNKPKTKTPTKEKKRKERRLSMALEEGGWYFKFEIT